MAGRSYVAKKNALWFGEANPFDSEGANEYLEAYKKARPVEIIPGYPIDAVASGFEGYQEFSECNYICHIYSPYLSAGALCTTLNYTLNCFIFVYDMPQYPSLQCRQPRI